MPPSNNQQQQYQMQRHRILQQLPQFWPSATQFECTQRIRKLVSIEREPPIKVVIDSGLRIIALSKFPHNDFDKTRCGDLFGAVCQLWPIVVWCVDLTNIALGTAENTAVVILYGVVPIFVKLLESKSDEAKEHAICALGNIAGDSSECIFSYPCTQIICKYLDARCQRRESDEIRLAKN